MKKTENGSEFNFTQFCSTVNQFPLYLTNNACQTATGCKSHLHMHWWKTSEILHKLDSSHRKVFCKNLSTCSKEHSPEK